MATVLLIPPANVAIIAQVRQRLSTAELAARLIAGVQIKAEAVSLSRNPGTVMPAPVGAPINSGRAILRTRRRRLPVHRPRSPVISSAGATPVQRVPSLPTDERQDADRNERQGRPRRHDRPLLIAGVPVEKLDHDDDRIAACAPPYVIHFANAPVTEQIGKTFPGGQRRHRDAGAEQPNRRGGPGVISAAPIEEVANESCNEKGERERDERGADAMFRDVLPAI